MSLQSRLYLSVVAAFCLFLSSVCRAGAAPNPASDYAGYLISQQRMRDAAISVSGAQDAGSVEALVGRSVLLLDAGRPDDAYAVFDQLQDRLPDGSVLPAYGQSICDLMSGKLEGAAKHLDACLAAHDYRLHKPQIDLARTVLMAVEGRFPASIPLGENADLPLAREIGLLDKLRHAPTDGANILAVSDLLTSWESAPGVPMVTDAPGLKALGGVDPAAKVVIEPAISSPNDVQSILRILLPQRGALQKVISGTVIVAPTTLSVSGDDLVTYYVDHQVAGVVNSAPFLYQWDTTRYTNGPHTITISVGEGGLGASETQMFEVSNKSGDTAARTKVALTNEDRAVIDDAWDLLTLQPSYKAAALQLSRAEMQAGEREHAIDHLTQAAAIDFEYAGGAKAITPLFLGHMPAWFPVPPGSHVGSAKPGELSKGIWCGSAPDKEVALTFDDGPSPIATPALLDVLRDNHVPATFMVVGIRAAAAPDIIRRMHAEGHEVEDHSYTHPNLDEATVDHIYEEILRDAVLISAMTGVWPHFLRPPGGQSNPHVLNAAETCGMAGAFWTVDVLPAEDLASPSSVVGLVLGRLRPGAVILMHNGASATTEAIPELAARLRQRGYRLVTLLELAKHTLASSPKRSASGTREARAVLQR